MGETTDAIRHQIDDQRHQLEDNLEGIEGKLKDTQEQVTAKVKHATDWRAQFQERPMVGLAVAFGGGVLLGTMLSGGGGGNGNRNQGAYQYQPQFQAYGGDGRASGSDIGRQHASSTLDNIKGALIGVAAAQAKTFLNDAVPGFNNEYRQVETKREQENQGTGAQASYAAQTPERQDM